MKAEAVTSGAGVKYNGYAHSFGEMGIQFILFLGIEVGVGLLAQRQTGVWKRLRAALPIALLTRCTLVFDALAVLRFRWDIDGRAG